MPAAPIRVLVVDDSPLVRSILEQGLARDPLIDVVGCAGDPYEARDRIVELGPDVLTLDVDMPRMDGVEFLKRLMPQHPLPVVMVSAYTERGRRITMEALDAGAVDFVAKPSASGADDLRDMLTELRAKVKAVARADLSHWKRGARGGSAIPKRPAAIRARAADRLVVIGASSGGTQAIKRLVSQFPPRMPGVLVVQHMPAGFTGLFAKSLDEEAALEVREAEAGDRVLPGRVLLAPASYHMSLGRLNGGYRIRLEQGSEVNGHKPSVEVLFQSAAREAGEKAVGVILTGIGADGAEGLLAMRRAGAPTFGQDEATCVVYGMPRRAWELGAVERKLDLDRMAREIVGLFAEGK